MTARQVEGIHLERVADEILAVKTASGEAHALNQSAAAVFDLCNGTASKAEMAAEIRRRTGLPADEAIVDLALAELVEAGLVVMTPSQPPAVISRRGLIGRLALSTAAVMMLPVVETFLLEHLPTVDYADVGIDRTCFECDFHPIDEYIGMPRDSSGTRDHDDFSPLMALVRARRPEMVLELGTAYGNLAANICLQLPNTHVYTVNALAETQTGKRFTYRLNADEIGRVYRRHGFSDRVTQILENTLTVDLVKHIAPHRVDFAIIDACHDVDYVLNDFLKTVQVLADPAFVVLHDTHPSMDGHLAGSYTACMLLRAYGYDIRHLRGTWWGIWRTDGWTDTAAPLPSQ